MLYKQLVSIHEKLKIWKDERGLTYEMQLAGLPANLLEECVEYLRAENEHEKIDALCDMLVFLLNSCDEVDEGMVYEIPINDHINSFIISNAAALISEYFSSVDCKDFKYRFKDMVNLIICIINKLGFKPYDAMLETIKEISSRTGKYDESKKKFIKEPGAYNREDALEYIITKFGNEQGILSEDENYWYYGAPTKTELTLKCDKLDGTTVSEFRPELRYYANPFTGQSEVMYETKIISGSVNGKIKKWYKANYDMCRSMK